jgi:phosphatidylserine decarboxylase
MVNNDMEIPLFLRSPLYRTYAWLFGCNLHEMKEPDLTKYPNLGSFFYREIQLSEHRPFDPNAALISPADGTLIHWGSVEMSKFVVSSQEQGPSLAASIVHGVKGVGYQVGTLLGYENHHKGLEPTNYTHMLSVNHHEYSVDSLIGTDDGKIQKSVVDHQHQLSEKERNEDPMGLFYAVIYLAPGDYHRFHSPANWSVHQRRHVHGELLSVSPKLLSVVPSLFTLNERVALLGTWAHGFFGMIPVGATNVGSIQINMDPGLVTNQNANAPNNQVDVLKFPVPPSLAAMEEVGGFKLGSTIVLVFEAPVRRFQWKVGSTTESDVNDPIKVLVGQTLGVISPQD